MTDESGLHVHTESEDGAVVVSPVGDVDLSRSPVLRTALKEVQGARPARVVVDLAGVDYMDSSGVATLVEALQNARKQSTRFVLCGLREKVRSVFEIARLDSVFTIAGSREEALRA